MSINYIFNMYIIQNKNDYQVYVVTEMYFH